MAVSAILEIPQVVETQSNKATAFNTALGFLEQAIADSYSFTTPLAVTPGFNYSLPFDDANDLSIRTALRFMYLEIQTGATAAFNVIHPDNEHLFFVRNNSGQNATIKTAAGAGVTIRDQGANIVYCDGVDCIAILPEGFTVTTPYDIMFQFFGPQAPNTSEVFAEVLVSRDVFLPANLLDSVFRVGTNPAATYVIDVLDDGVDIGDISISTGGVVTVTLAEQTVAAGSVLALRAPATVDATFTEFRAIFNATTDVVQ